MTHSIDAPPPMTTGTGTATDTKEMAKDEAANVKDTAVQAGSQVASTATDQAKQVAADAAAGIVEDGMLLGIGSGSTIKYVVDAIAENLAKQADPKPKIVFVPTGYQSRQVILAAGLTPLLFDQLPDDVVLDVAFDGADEVDDDLNCIKGGGACLFQEKLVAQRAKKFVCVAGTSHTTPSTPFISHLTSLPKTTANSNPAS